LLFSGLPLFPAGLHAQKQDETAGDNQRKVINRVVPQYPDLARRMHLNGVVKIEAEVASNGTVKDVSLKGGHPVLAQAALNAVRKWRWAPAAHETAERIEVKFDPDN
jgi:TonB family protein